MGLLRLERGYDSSIARTASMLRGISDAIDSVGGRFAGYKISFVEEALAHESLSDGEYAV